MALYVKDPEVDALAKRLMALRHVNKTEAVRQALRNELAREEAKPSLVEIGMAFARQLNAEGDPQNGQPVDKAYLDSLYEDE
jgi:antitoxin VapB